ncbi:hypothetical protein BpHYR1_008747 [Brachionus plicatilis]|uniref:Uncharacterized protein n=1 Tax=Brachionus plicatilis TaxID=10195 RepID=A0A3M7QIF9_BRAPC|nr:hypothetical protein BpHYR1_008747 [Brachionus plicatilis]
MEKKLEFKRLNEKFNENFKKRVTFEDNELDDADKKKTIEEQREKIDLLQKSLEEQEELMKGYQKENERLYSEMKKTKQDTQKHVSALEQEKKQLKLDLIHERLQEDNKKPIIASQTHKSLDNISKVILPITEQTCPESLVDKQIQQLTQDNFELKKIVDFYEKNQQQIEQDVKIIDEKNKQIKKLNDKMQKIQMNKTGPDFVREITRLKKQLQEMDLVIKRMRQGKKSEASPINLSIDYYEQRIQDLEVKLKDKSLDVERLSRMWHQKMFLYKKLRDQESGVVSRDRDLSPLVKKMDQENHEKIRHLEVMNQNLRNSVKSLQDQICDKERQIELLKSSNTKSYQPSDFVVKQEKVVESADLDSMRHVYSQIENLKIKLCKKENELALVQRDHEHKIEQIKNLNWKKWEDLSQKHRAEMEKLINAFTGAKIVLNGLDGESVFDDPIKFRLLIEACNRSRESQAKIGKLGQINKQLSQKCVYLESLVQRLSAGGEKNSEVWEESAEMGRIVTFYENQLRVKNDEIEKFRNELDTMLKILQSLNS